MDVIVSNAQAVDFVTDQYRHCKPIMVMGASARLLDLVGIPLALPNGKSDSGIVVDDGGGDLIMDFIWALAAHRHTERETDPPRI